jgi:hypothetical protein
VCWQRFRPGIVGDIRAELDQVGAISGGQRVELRRARRRCEDTNVCTDDHCNGAGACIHPANTASCDDGLYCNGTDTCAGGMCVHSRDPCTTGSECADACNEAADNCFDCRDYGPSASIHAEGANQGPRT